jgi:hypothetical protein
MDTRSNSIEIILFLEHNMAFGLVVTALTLIIICIFCTIHKIGAKAERTMQTQLDQINDQRIIAPPNTPIDNAQNVQNL